MKRKSIDEAIQELEAEIEVRQITVAILKGRLAFYRAAQATFGMLGLKGKVIVHTRTPGNVVEEAEKVVRESGKGK